MRLLDDIENDIGAVIGHLEEAGLRYPVRSYAKWVDEPVLMRGARLDAPDRYENLKEWGFKSIIDLRLENPWDLSYDASKSLAVFRIPVLDNTAPTLDQIARFLEIVGNKAHTPAYVHCQAGVGRTGVFCAAYRVKVQGWTPERAISEMQSFGNPVPAQIDFVRSL